MNVQARSLKTRDSASHLPTVTNKYVTSGNRTIYVPGGAKIGDYVWTPRTSDDGEFDLSEIVGPINATTTEH